MFWILQLSLMVASQECSDKMEAGPSGPINCSDQSDDSLATSIYDVSVRYYYWAIPETVVNVVELVSVTKWSSQSWYVNNAVKIEWLPAAV